MPCDVATCWNFTHTMLKFAGKYCSALELITGNQNLMLQSHELDDTEWSLVEQLYNILKVPDSRASKSGSKTGEKPDFELDRN
jgi:hypothetical protein